jgi:DNA-binding MarR family transcriptional regulator
MSDGECGFGRGEHGRVPLVRLLHRAEIAYVAEFDRRLADTAYTSLTLAHSRGVLRHLGDGPVRASRLVDECGVSKQAVSQQIAQLEAAGYVAVTADPSDARARVVTLTERGAAASGPCMTSLPRSRPTGRSASATTNWNGSGEH